MKPNINDSFYIINCLNVNFHVPNPQNNSNVYAVICLLLMLSIPIITMNIYIVGITYYCKSMRSAVSILLAIASFWDLLVGVFSNIPIAAVLIMSISLTHDCTLFLFSMFTSYTFGFISFLAVGLSSIDLYIAVFQPFFYQKYIYDNPMVYIKCICVITTLIVLIMILSYLTQTGLYFLFLIYVSPILFLTIFYIHARLHLQVKWVRQTILFLTPNPIKSNQIQSNQIKSNCSTNKNIIMSIRDSLSEKKFQKVNKFTMMVYASTCFAYMPFVAIFYLWNFKSISLSWKWTRNFYLWAHLMAMTKSLANPTIYFYRSRILRQSLMRVKQSHSKSNHSNNRE